jgi:hypothetical protein
MNLVDAEVEPATRPRLQRPRHEAATLVAMPGPAAMVSNVDSTDAVTP